jgi:hypothetical protein|tara:strand:- start:7463 stop:7720 length:258 start_codon:yes stop_codon:yes gene_type:complete
MHKPKFIEAVRSITMILFFVVATFGLAQHNEVETLVVSTFKIGNIVNSPGETYRGKLKVPSGDDKIETFIPITVHHGTRPGPYCP